MSKKVINEMMKELQEYGLELKFDNTVTETKIKEMIESGLYYKTGLGFVRFTQEGWIAIDQTMKHGADYDSYMKYVEWEEEFAKVKIRINN